MTQSSFDVQGTFQEVVAALAETGVPYAFIGALPVLAWGRVRATTDIDLVVSVETQWTGFANALAKRGIRPSKTVGPADTTDALPDIAVFRSSRAVGTRVDVFIAKTAFERAVIDSARTAEVLGSTVRLASPEASIVYKLLAQRPRDMDDVESVFEARTAADDALDWVFLDRWTAAWGIADRLAVFGNRYRR